MGSEGRGAGQARTLHPVSRPHNAQGAGGAGGQGPLMPVPSRALARPQWAGEEAGLCPGAQSGSILISRGECVTLLAGNGGPPRRGGRGNRAVPVPESAPHSAPGSDWPLVPGPCTSLRQGQAGPKVDKEKCSPAQTGPHRRQDSETCTHGS